MKVQRPIQPAIRTLERGPGDDVSPCLSAMVGVTLLGDMEDVLAAVRTVALLARNFRASLSLGLPGTAVLEFDLGETPCSTVPELLESTRVQFAKTLTTTFAMELDVVAASFVGEGAITMRVRTANASEGRKQPA